MHEGTPAAAPPTGARVRPCRIKRWAKTVFVGVADTPRRADPTTLRAFPALETATARETIEESADWLRTASRGFPSLNRDSVESLSRSRAGTRRRGHDDETVLPETFSRSRSSSTFFADRVCRARCRTPVTNSTCSATRVRAGDVREEGATLGEDPEGW